MNVEPAPGQTVNGLAFPITDQELETLDRREACYERRVVPMRSFETGEHAGEGHMYVGREPWIRRQAA